MASWKTLLYFSICLYVMEAMADLNKNLVLILMSHSGSLLFIKINAL